MPESALHGKLGILFEAYHHVVTPCISLAKAKEHILIKASNNIPSGVLQDPGCGI